MAAILKSNMAAVQNVYCSIAPPSLYEKSMALTQISVAGKDSKAAPKTRWAASTKHDLYSAGLNNTDAAQMVFDRPRWKAFVCGLPTLEPEQVSKSSPQRSDIEIYFLWLHLRFLVEETDRSIYKLFYSGHFEIQDGHHIGSNLVNISPAGRDSKIISKSVCVLHHIMFDMI